MTWYVGLVDFSGESEVQSDGRCVSSYMRKYLVRTTEATWQHEGQVGTALGIARGSPLSSNANAICYKLSIGPGPTMTRAPHLAYFATALYSTAANLPEDDDDDPTTTRTKWSIAPQIQSRYVVKDRNDELIVNAAGTPFDGGVPVDVRLGSVTARRNVTAAGYDRDAVLANSGKLNSATYLGGEPGTVQVDISAEEMYEGGYHFWAETYTFSYDPLGWQPKPVNAGFYQLVDDVLHEITNADIDVAENPTARVPEPEPLDADGLLVPHASRPASCTFVEVEYFGDMDFDTFDL